MKNLNLFKDDILERLKRLDMRVSLELNESTRFRLVIVGGGAFVLRDYINRSTDDIDVIEADSRLAQIMELYDINGRVNSFMDHFPLNYPDRIEAVWSGRVIDYYTASLEDIVISKICAGRDKDWDDLAKVYDLVDWDRLDYLAYSDGELKLSMLSDRRYMDFTANYEIFERRYRPCKD